MPPRKTARGKIRTAAATLDRPPLRKLTAAQAAAFDGSRVDRPAAIPLSPADRTAVNDAVAAVNTLMLSALLHRFDPAAYPVGASASAMEKAMVKHVAELSPKTFARMVPGIARVTSTASLRKKYLRHLSDIELNKPDVSRRVVMALKSKKVTLKVKPRSAPPPPPVNSPNWTALHLQVRPENPALRLYERSGFSRSPRLILTRRLR